eukprot:Phypoly_transcript_02725.p1 GENE.Phypoly_transcript_02725~~Phypoly_transcript_02725.p1  ORF type:complete len:787 (+),score=137.98 Phypoly_transcript_02725:291-2651(+)
MSKRPLQRSALVLGRMDDNVVVQGDLDKSAATNVESSHSPKRPKADGEENSNEAPHKLSRALSSKSTTKISTKPTPITRVRASASSSSLRSSKGVEREVDGELDKENKVSITLSDINSSEDHASTDNGPADAVQTSPSIQSTPSVTSPAATPSTTPIPPSNTSQRPAGTWRVPTGTKGNSKYNTLPIPPKSKYPSLSTTSQTTPSSSTSSQPTTSPSTPGQTTSSGQSTTNKPAAPLSKPASTLGKTSAPSLTFKNPSGKLSAKSAAKPSAGRPPSTLQLQEQTRRLLQQIHQQQQQLEQQQQQLEHSHLTQQQLQQKLQLQELEQQLLQVEQTEKEKQLEKQQTWQQFHNGQPQLSPAAKMFISQNSFQSHHSEKRSSPSSADFLHTGTYIAEFTHTPTQAIAAYNEWKEALWLIPHAFSSQLDPLMLTAMHLPFYAFSLITHSVHSGKVGYFKKPEGPEVSSIEFSAIKYEFAKDRAETFVHTQLHPDILVYAPSFELVTTPDYDLMQEIWYWKLGDLKPHGAPTTNSRRLSMPSLTRSTSATTLDIKMPHPTTVQDAWAHAHKKLIENERYCADQTIKRQHICDTVEEINTTTSFSHVAVKLIYLPVYVWTHNYQGATYHTVMNAQNGIVYGRRPYSLASSLDSCFQLLAGGEQLLSKNDLIHGVITGSNLAQRDNFPPHSSPYRVDLPYIVFPPSDQFLVMVTTGWLRVQNTSESEAVELVAQKRTTSQIGRSLVLLPGDEKVIAYRGAWCFCVTVGDPQSVIIAYVCTHSGADKEDLMGMV